MLRCRSDNIDDLAVQLVEVIVCDISMISCVDLVVDAIAEDIPVGLGGFPLWCSNTLSFWANAAALPFYRDEHRKLHELVV